MRFRARIALPVLLGATMAGAALAQAAPASVLPREGQMGYLNGGIGKEQAEQLLNSAEREERNVQARKQQQNRPQPPPGGKDW